MEMKLTGVSELGELAGSSFWTDVRAGLLVMCIEVLLTVTAVAWVTRYFENRKWKRTRQMLAGVLLKTLGNEKAGVIKSFRSLLAQRHGNLMFNSSIELHLARLDLHLTMLHEQMLVHLPALLPPLTERLSDMTNEISNLRGQVLAAKSHLSEIDEGMQHYSKFSEDGKIPGEFFVSNRLFHFNDEGADLNDGESPKDKYYLYQFISRIFVLTFSLADHIAKFFEEYKGDLEKSPTEAAQLENAKVYVRREIDQAKAEYGKLISDGLYLVRYSAPSRELNDGESTRQ